MIYLTISKQDITSSPNKTIAFDVDIIKYVDKKSKLYGGRETLYYEFEIIPHNLIMPDGSDWTGIKCSFDFPKELYDIVGKNAAKAHIEVRQLKSNGKFFNCWAKSHILETMIIDNNQEQPKIEQETDMSKSSTINKIDTLVSKLKVKPGESIPVEKVIGALLSVKKEVEPIVEVPTLEVPKAKEPECFLFQSPEAKKIVEEPMDLVGNCQVIFKLCYKASGKVARKKIIREVVSSQGLSLESVCEGFIEHAYKLLEKGHNSTVRAEIIDCCYELLGRENPAKKPKVVAEETTTTTETEEVITDEMCEKIDFNE